MATPTERIEFRLSRDEKDCLRRAAARTGVSIAAFVRAAVGHEVDRVLANEAREGGLAAELRGRATARLSAEGIMRLTRGY